MTQFTSFVAVEEQIVTEGGKPRRVEVPVEMPEGVSYEGVFGQGNERAERRAGRGRDWLIRAWPPTMSACIFATDAVAPNAPRRSGARDGPGSRGGNLKRAIEGGGQGPPDDGGLASGKLDPALLSLFERHQQGA